MNSSKNSVQGLNAQLVTALLSLFFTGISLLIIGFFFSFEYFDILIEEEEYVLYQNLLLAIILIGLILIVLGTLKSFGIMSKTRKLIDYTLSREDLEQPSSQGSVGGLRIIRPDMYSKAPVKSIAPKPTKAPQRIQAPLKKQPVSAPTAKKELEKGAPIDISLEEGLQMIIDRYNNPKVSKSFSNWQNTLMMNFPDLERCFLFRVNNDQGIELEEGYDEEAAVQVNLDSEIFLKMMTKQINPIKAYSSGKLEVKGKMRNLLKLRKLMF